MEPIEIAGQILSVAAMACNVLSYQQKKQRTLLLLQMLGCTLFSASYFMLGATMGTILNIIAAIRAIIFSFPDKLKTSHPAWQVGFGISYVTMYVLGFTVFEIEVSPISLIIEFLPVFAMAALSVGFMLGTSKAVRRTGTLASPAWLVYNIYYMSIGALIGEGLNIASIFIGMARHDKTSKDEQGKAGGGEKSADDPDGYMGT